MFSILHISDLHRSSEEPVDNDSLLAALLADRDRYAGETPRIPPPSAIVVSGDLIQGARIDAPNWQQSIKDQYAVADNFLTALCAVGCPSTPSQPRAWTRPITPQAMIAVR